VNPVPVSVVREMGADLVIAVDLNHDIIGKKGVKKASISNSDNMALGKEIGNSFTEGNRILNALNKKVRAIDIPKLTQIKQWMARDPMPNIFEVLMTSISIMETQITDTKLKTDRPDMLIQPHLGRIRFLEFNRAEEAIVAGYEETKLCIQTSFI
ncbi:MAG: patatin, partial [Deltaproteobacteria bacterium]|nr:patatin [Deltaproteobacteria bacterium]